MTKLFKAGDKVRILNAAEISGCEAKDGDLLKVIYVDESDGTPVLEDVDGGGLIMFPSELKYIELADEKLKKKKRIELLEAEVAALKAEFEAFKRCCACADKATTTVKEQTPNDQRKAIIAEAKEFVETVSAHIGKNHSKHIEGIGELNNLGFTYILKPEFVVNEEKRAVTVLLKGGVRNTGHIYGKEVTKCAPTDVFNAEIGKAIALGRVLGLDVSKFENAPRPVEFAIGQSVTPKWTSVDSFREKPAKIVKFETRSFGTTGVFVDAHNPHRSDKMTWAGLDALTIVADTEAVYE